MARIALSYPGLEGWDVAPATIEVPLGEARWRGWLWHHGPWALTGVPVVAGAAWLAVRNRARAGRGRKGPPAQESAAP